MGRDRVLVCLAPATRERVAGWFDGLAGLDLRVLDPRTPEAARAAVGNADIVIPDWSAAIRLDAPMLEAAPRLALVMSAAVGLDAVDLPDLTRAGVIVANTAGLNARSVAEWCLGAALAVARSLAWIDGEVREGRWPQLEIPSRGATELGGRRVGVVGFGAVGSQVAGLFRAIGCDVAYWTRRARTVDETDLAWLELDELIARSDVLVVNLALTDETRGLLGAERLAGLPEGAIVVDASRGGIVDLDAVAAMVEVGRLRGAALDVFAVEPLPAEASVRRSDRILLSSHAASATAESHARVFAFVRENVRRALHGEPLERIVNGLGPVVAWRDEG